MADPYYKGTPYGWCCDHNLEKSIYDKTTWQEYVKTLEEWLNKRECNYSVVHYKNIVRVHVYFSALKKMGYRNAVDLYWMSQCQQTDNEKLYSKIGFGRPWTYKDVERHVKEYFIKNDLEITDEMFEGIDV